jgi:hypothetical protein
MQVRNPAPAAAAKCNLGELATHVEALRPSCGDDALLNAHLDAALRAMRLAALVHRVVQADIVAAQERPDSHPRSRVRPPGRDDPARRRHPRLAPRSPDGRGGRRRFQPSDEAA